MRTQPAIGRKGHFFNQKFTSHIAGVSERESKAILALRLDHLAQPEFQLRSSWKPGALGIYALADYLPHHRRMRRAMIFGDWPV